MGGGKGGVSESIPYGGGAKQGIHAMYGLMWWEKAGLSEVIPCVGCGKAGVLEATPYVDRARQVPASRPYMGVWGQGKGRVS